MAISGKPRTVLLLLWILVLVMVAFLLIRGRHPNAIASMRPSTGLPAASYPAGTQHADLPPSGGDGAGTVEVCGFGRVPIDKGDPGAIFQRVGVLTKEAGTRWLSALQNSGDLRARVAGLLLEGKVTGDGTVRPVAEQTRNEVVQLAVGAEDPAVYAMALSMCETSAATEAASACPRLSAQRWARMDPDNAEPWLLVAGEARARHDGAGEAAAFSRAAAAHKIESYNYSLFAFAEAELPQDITPLQRAYLAIEVMGVEGAVGSPSGSAGYHCSSTAQQDSTVRRQCNSLAELLVAKGTNLLDLGLGTSIGTRAGWPSERVEALVQEQHALIQAIMQQTPSDNDTLWTCDAVSRLNSYMVQRAQLGELGAARDMLERSGESAEQMARQYTQYLDELRRDALMQQQRRNPPDIVP
jgi:hypothetical protein